MIHPRCIFARSRRMLALLGTHSAARPALAASSTVVISQFETGVFSAGNEFIKLHNIGATAYDLNGHTLVYRAATGAADFIVVSWSTNTVIPPGGYYLVAHSSGYDGSVASDISFASNAANGQLSAAGGGLALRNGVADTA